MHLGSQLLPVEDLRQGATPTPKQSSPQQIQIDRKATIPSGLSMEFEKPWSVAWPISLISCALAVRDVIMFWCPLIL